MILIIDCGSSKTRFIEEAVDLHCDFKTIPLLDLEESMLDQFEGVIISGAPILVTEVDTTPYLEKLNWIEKTDIPVLGICFGHQMIGLIFGAFASRMKDVRDLETVEVIQDSPLFNRLPHEMRLMEDHCEAISIPAGFDLLASSDSCVNEAMSHQTKPIYGVQFHPETSGNHGFMIIENFIRTFIDQGYH
jgi:GMP synthase (glutamine-hydrolysing)